MHNTTEWQSQCSDHHVNLNEARNVRQRLDEAWGMNNDGETEILLLDIIIMLTRFTSIYHVLGN